MGQFPLTKFLICFTTSLSPLFQHTNFLIYLPPSPPNFKIVLLTFIKALQRSQSQFTHHIPACAARTSTVAVRRMGLVEEIYGPQIEDNQLPATVYEYQNTPENRSWAGALPIKQGLYDPEYEKDACGVGFAASVPTNPLSKESTLTDSTAISRAMRATRSLAMVSTLPRIPFDPASRADTWVIAQNLLCNMTHRGAVGSDARDGDGAGVMTSMPHKFFIKNFAKETGFDLPPQGQYAAGNLFFKPDTEILKESTTIFEEIADELGLRVLGWREVPRDTSLLGPAALSREPLILQPFVVLRKAYGDGNTPDSVEGGHFDELLFERQLYVLRKRATHTIGLHNWFYLCSLSNKNIVYKGQLSPVQVYQYYHDLVSVDYEGHFALVHSRFSTNTFPSWDRAQPLRWAAHNGKPHSWLGSSSIPC